MAIRIMRKDIERLSSINKRSYQKDYRLKTNFGKAVAPDRITDISDFRTRKQFNAYIRQQEKFLQRDSNRYVKNRYGDVFSRDAVDKVQKTINSANERLKAEEKVMTGSNYNARKSLMKSSKYDLFARRQLNLNKFRANNLMNAIDKYTYVGSQQYFETIYQKYHENYIKALNTEFGSAADPIIRCVEGISYQDFAKLYFQDKTGAMSISFIYDKFVMYDKLKEIRDFFISKGYAVDEIDEDLLLKKA